MPGRLMVVAAVIVGAVIQGVVGAGTPAEAAIQPGFGYWQILSPGPLTSINVAKDTTLQVVDNRVGTQGEFFPAGSTCTGDFGVVVDMGNRVYGPSPQSPWHCPGSTFVQPDTVFTPISQAIGGQGTPGSPYYVSTVVGLTGTVTLNQTVKYVIGSTFFMETDTLSTTSTAPVTARIYNTGQPAPGGYAVSSGYRDPVSGDIGSFNPIDPVKTTIYPCSGALASPFGYFVTLHAVNPWNHFMVAQSNLVYNGVRGGASGANLPDTVNTSCQNTAVAVQWNVSAVSGTPASVSKAVSFTSTLPPYGGGSVTGKAMCNTATSLTVTCSPIPPAQCPGCGSAFNFLIPVACGGAMAPGSLQLHACTGALLGHIGLPTYSVTVTAGGFFNPAPNVDEAVLSGFGYYAGLPATFGLTVVDNESTGRDSLQVRITQQHLTATYGYTCPCLEVQPT